MKQKRSEHDKNERLIMLSLLFTYTSGLLAWLKKAFTKMAENLRMFTQTQSRMLKSFFDNHNALISSSIVDLDYSHIRQLREFRFITQVSSQKSQE